MSVPPVVLDTNVVLDWLVFDDAAVRPIAAAIEAGRLRWLRSDTMAGELARVLDYPAVQTRLTDRDGVLARAERLAVRVAAPAPAPPTLRCTDPDDQCFIDLALTHPGGWLISRDKALLALRQRALALGVRVATPRLWES